MAITTSWGVQLAFAGGLTLLTLVEVAPEHEFPAGVPLLPAAGTSRRGRVKRGVTTRLPLLVVDDA